MNPLFIPYQNCEFIVLPDRISMPGVRVFMALKNRPKSV